MTIVTAATGEYGAAVSPRIAALFPLPVAAAEIAGDALAFSPQDGDPQFLHQAAPRRRRDYAAGRACAAQALTALGSPQRAIERQDDGSPRWPLGFVGSISHTDALCGAVAARRGHTLALGLDIERAGRLDEDMLGEICTAEERSWLDGLPAQQAAILAMVLFSAKEAFYKCQYAISGAWLDFQDVTPRLHPDGSIEPTRVPEAAGQNVYSGRYLLDTGHVLTGFCAAPR